MVEAYLIASAVLRWIYRLAGQQFHGLILDKLR
jgi:hypothetical protein